MRLSVPAPGQACVEVLDDGVGMPPPPAGKPRGLGFQMLPLLAEQCGSRLEQMPGPGTHFRFVLQLDAMTIQGESDV